MQNLIRHLQNISERSSSFGEAVLNTAKDLGIDIGFDNPISFDIFDDFPKEGFTLEEIDLIIATGIVRRFRKMNNKDADLIPIISSNFDFMASKDLLTGAEIQSYHTLMNLLHCIPPTDQNTHKTYPPGTLLPPGQREL